MRHDIIKLNKLIMFILLLPINSIFAQFGYYYSGDYVLPDTLIRLPAQDIFISPEKEDVKAVGMGKTQFANGNYFNAMMYNPALLSRKRIAFDILGAQASIPSVSYDAARFLVDNRSQLTREGSTYIRQIRQGYIDYVNAGSVEQRIAALRLIVDGLKFPKQLNDKVIGSADDPYRHGLKVIPGLQIQWENFGFSLFAVAQTGFMVSPGQLFQELQKINIPQDATGLTQQELFILADVANNLFDQYGNLNVNDAFPKVLSISYADIIGAFGYAFDLNEYLSLGANLKLINRRVSARNIVLDDVDGTSALFKQTVDDFQSSIFGFTMDLGSLLKFPSFNTQFAVSLQNIIPVQKITSTANFDFIQYGLIYATDALGRKIVNNSGDTAIVSVKQTSHINLPVQLKAPFLFNIGAIHSIFKDWNVALDIYDIAEQDNKFERYWERLRIGTEYRLWAKNNSVGIAFRTGMADLHFTGGIGFDIYNILQIDAAYAFDSYVRQNSYFLQIKLGW